MLKLLAGLDAGPGPTMHVEVGARDSAVELYKLRDDQGEGRDML